MRFSASKAVGSILGRRDALARIPSQVESTLRMNISVARSSKRFRRVLGDRAASRAVAVGREKGVCTVGQIATVREEES